MKHGNDGPGARRDRPAPTPISHRLKPRLATAVFHRYLYGCFPTGPHQAGPPAGTRRETPEPAQIGHRHHH